ncbi:lipase 3-like [Drosophila takahashii]|uniref:lipase 3-like n=1 Tax=Drosophila takahashii TaxID=29030 RepID=UPI001CF880A7|nr:lipase 3-like [Drosophila takahashii]
MYIMYNRCYLTRGYWRCRYNGGYRRYRVGGLWKVELYGTRIRLRMRARGQASLILNHNYPVKEHTVHTPDDYILTIYRIPTTPKRNHQNQTAEKPVVFLQHGILCASDDWIINGPETSLAYMFTDAGYDVWLGNARGNTYSRQHKHIHPDTSDFWRFSWHEIGVYDLAAMLDYALAESQSNSLHFVAHSQGTTTFFVLMSSLPWYNEKMRSVHLLAPMVHPGSYTDYEAMKAKKAKTNMELSFYVPLTLTISGAGPTADRQQNWANNDEVVQRWKLQRLQSPTTSYSAAQPLQSTRWRQQHFPGQVTTKLQDDAGSDVNRERSEASRHRGKT